MGEVWAVGMFRDEADVAADVLRHLADEGVDGIIVADNRSVDATWRIVNDVGVELGETHDLPVLVVQDTEPGFYQSRKTTSLAARAAEAGAEWIVPFDADEVWVAHDGRLADVLRDQTAEVTVVEATLWNHFATALDRADPSPFRSMVYRQRHPGPLPKVAFRWQPGAVVHQGNHGVTVPDPGKVAVGELEVRHFPYRSFEHFARKAANGLEAYTATDLPETEGAHWRQYGALLERHGSDALREVFTTYFWFLAPTCADLILDPAPFRRWARR